MIVCPSCGRQTPEGFERCANCGAALARPGSEQRKTVSVLFCDVTGSTALGESTDPEALRVLLARFFERMKAIVEAHGGSVEKFIGDAVMAVFGVPQVHEDDALRAVRAAVEMRDALPALGIQARIGVNTGEVVTGTQERLATGDAVNVAARLEQSAAPGEVLIGPETYRMVSDAVETGDPHAVRLKGKSDPIPARRLVAVHDAPERAHESPFVGRESELEKVRDSWRRVVDEQRCELVTVVGDAGVGKSRLVAEALEPLGIRVVRARCLPYGRGITYWPAVEVIRQLGSRPAEASAAAAIGSLLGETSGATSPDEIAWAFRRLLEQEAPLVCVFDDLHWAEDTFLDLIEHVALLSVGAPIMLVCTARPELLERRPQWTASLRLSPLPEDNVEALIPNVLETALRQRIAHAAGGNPLFIHEMVAMASESATGVAVPPTLQALLQARLDQLELHERQVLERGAVEGELFHRGSVQALSDDGQVTPRLAALVRKELIRPDRAELPAEDAFRFRHLLIRDAAYDAMPKATRADLHERFASWLEERGQDLVELDEILGYHLEQAVRYRGELGLPVDPDLQVAARARLTAAGRRASIHGDYPTEVNLLERAAALVPRSEIDAELEYDLVEACFRLDIRDAVQRARSLVERAEAIGAGGAALCGRVLELRIAGQSGGAASADELEVVANKLLRVAEEAGDQFGRYVAQVGRIYANHERALFDLELEAVERAVAEAREMGRPDLEISLLPMGAASRMFGSTPVDELLAWLDELDARGLQRGLASYRAYALAMAGRFDEARAIHAAGRRELAERGAKVYLALATAHNATDIELYAGDWAAAARYAEEGCRLLAEVGDRGWLCTAHAKLGHAYERLGRLDEAAAQVALSRELGASDDIANEQQWREVEARVLARRGETEAAERVARELVALAGPGDLMGRNFGLLVLAEVLELNGDVKQATETLELVIDGFERKGLVPMAERARQQLAGLRRQSSERGGADTRI